jgi:hypothetical protein
MENIKNIVNKIRQLAASQQDADIRDVAKTTPTIISFFVDDEVQLDHIRFENDYDKLVVSKTHMVYKPEFAQKRILYTYNGWNELLSL